MGIIEVVIRGIQSAFWSLSLLINETQLRVIQQNLFIYGVDGQLIFVDLNSAQLHL